MKPLFKNLVTLIISSLLFMNAAAQDQAELLFENATTFMNAGKYKDALSDLENIIKDYRQTPWASKALLEVGNYYHQYEADYEKASAYYAQILDEYAASSEAPGAYYFKADIVERQGETAAELESAVADLIRMRNLYPNNPWLASGTFLLGKLAYRLGNYTECLKYFQGLEFSNPQSPFLPSTLLMSAQAAWLKGSAKQAALILARLQSKFPNSPEADKAQSYLRLMDRFTRSGNVYQLDQPFFGTTPKTYSNPTGVCVSSDNLVGVKDQKGAHFAPLGDYSQNRSVMGRDIVGFCKDRSGNLLTVFENRILTQDGSAPWPSLGVSGSQLRDISAAAVDNFGRLYVADDGLRDVAVFSKSGDLIKTLSVNKAKMVRTYGGEAWVLTSDSGTINRFDASLNSRSDGVSGLSGVWDYRFDPYGNLYVLCDKGYSVKIYTRMGKLHTAINLKNGALPLKQAWSIGVDATGAFYLADRRGGSVYRFH